MVDKSRDYDREYRLYHGTPEQIKKRSSRNKARRKMAKKVGKAALRGKDVDHKNSNPESNSYSNLRVQSKHANRSYSRKREKGHGNRYGK